MNIITYGSSPPSILRSEAAADLFAPVYGGPWNDMLMADPDFCAYYGLARPADPIVEQWFAGGRGSFKSSYISVAVAAVMSACPRELADWHDIVFRKVAAEIEEPVFPLRLELLYPWLL